MPTYVVQRGDTLSKIARKLGLRNYRELTGYRSGNPNLIYPGEVLSYGSSRGPVISRSVGKKGINQRNDVITIQKLLNKNIGKLAPLATLSENGRVDKFTLEAIDRFQRRVVGMSAPDRRVDPGGKTLSKLIKGGPSQAGGDAQPTTSDPLQLVGSGLRKAIQRFDAYRVNGNLKPSDYAQRWLRCPVDVNQDQTVYVNIGNYRMVNLRDDVTTPDVDEGAPDRANSNAMIQTINRFIGNDPDDPDRLDLRQRLGGGVVRKVSNGKGLPHEVSLVLSALACAGAIPLANQTFTAAEIETYAKQTVGSGPRIGVDCSGFVNGYFVCKGLHPTRQNIIRRYARPWVNRCRDNLPTQVLDHVLVWDDYRHIALVESHGSSQSSLRVVESCHSGRGVRDWSYSLQRYPDTSKRQTDIRHWTWGMLRMQQGNSPQEVFLARHL